MKTRTTLSIITITSVLMMGVGYLLLGNSSNLLATHWNALGEADGYGTAFMGLYFLPLFAVAISCFIVFLPMIDPLKANVEKFRREYNLMVLAIAGFMLYIQGLTLAWNQGIKLSMNGMIAPGFGILFMIVGVIIRKVKRNYFIGIKTPWALANDTVWEKTHEFGGKLFIASGVLTLACVFCPNASVFVLLFTAIGASLITAVYSYLIFRQIEKTDPVK